MKFKELSLENYKIFYGNNLLRFDKNKKIFVVQGLNGYGKSTLVEAVLFALYGKAQSNIINDYALQNNQNFCRVSLEFEHNGSNYKATREIIDTAEKFILKVDGEISTLKIENIIPENVAKLSILDCEKFARLINTELGFEDRWGVKELKKAKGDLELLRSKLGSSMSRGEKIKSLIKKILKLDISRIEARKLEKLVALESAKIKALHSKIEDLEKLIEASAFLEKEREFKQNFPALILKNLLEDAVKIILERKDNAIKARLKQGRLSAEIEFLEKILAEEKCLCGSKLSTSRFGKREITKLLTKLKEEEKLFGSLPLEGYARSGYELSAAVEKVKNLKINLGELIKEREQLSETLPKARNLNYINLTKKLEELKLENKARELKVIELEEGHKKLAEKIKKGEALNRRSVLLKIKKLENLICAFDEIIEWKSKEESRSVSELASNTLKLLTNKPLEYEGIIVDSGGRVEVEGSSLKRLSDGERQIIGLSLIAGLKNEFLIIDAPFTRLDSEHKKNLIANLRKFANQLIVLVTDEDYKDLEEFAECAWQLAHDEGRRSSKIKCVLG